MISDDLNESYYEMIWNKVCGEGSVLALMNDTLGLSVLVVDLVVDMVESDEFEAFASHDDENQLPMIGFTTGCFDVIKAICAKGMAVLSQSTDDETQVWQQLGYGASDFSSLGAFSEHIAEIVFDFVILHELAHIGRGHVAQYCLQNGMGLFEVETPADNSLTGLQRIALELDADNIAIYLLVIGRDVFSSQLPRYQLAANDESYIGTLCLAKNILFALLADINKDNTAKRDGQTSLLQSHWGMTHPHPSVRQEFSDQRITQLADDEQQAQVFLQYLELGYGLFLEMVQAEVFDILSLQSWQHDSEELADFLNVLIREIETMDQMGWMNADSRMAAANAIWEQLES